MLITSHVTKKIQLKIALKSTDKKIALNNKKSRISPKKSLKIAKFIDLKSSISIKTLAKPIKLVLDFFFFFFDKLDTSWLRTQKIKSIGRLKRALGWFFCRGSLRTLIDGEALILILSTLWEVYMLTWNTISNHKLLMKI